MKTLLHNLRGDKVIWSFVALLALFSFMPVFSASTNLAYTNGGGNTLAFIVKHFVHIFIGFLIIYWVHKVPYHYFRNAVLLALPFVWLVQAITLFQGTVIGGANAARWIQVPFIGISFQPSTLAFITLMIYVARFLSRKRTEPLSFKNSLWELWLPVGITILLVLPANFSTAALMFSMVVMLVFIGQYPLKYIGLILGSAVIVLAFFVLVAKAFPDATFFNRVHTWESRLTNFTTDKPDEDNYQIEKAKIAIASGKIYGLGPGKSVQKNFLPQSSSDFIYAVIVEEYGLIGGFGVLLIYLLLFLRFVVAAHKANSIFGKLLVVGLGFPIVFQALINMAVAVELLPVTGQTLPLISSGGSSIWMTCISLGIIIGVTKKEEEIAQELEEKQQREDVLQRLIDQQLKREELAEAELATRDIVTEEVPSGDANPMDAVRNK